jgi:hypothetical protein
MESITDLKAITKRIIRLQCELAKLGPMRPGCLSRQYRDPQRKKGAYYQLSYTYKMRSKTEYILEDSVPEIRRELAEYKRYKELNGEWIQLSIERSRLQIKQAKKTAARISKNS